MSISSEANRNDYTGNGAASSYDYTFRITSQNQLLVTVKDTDDAESTLIITTDFTVSGVGSDSGGSITLVDSGQDWLDGDGDLLTGYTITIRRVVDIIQETDIRNQGDFFPEVHEDAFDYLTFIDQQQQDEIDRSVKNPESLPASTFDPTLPTDINQASVTFGTNPSGNGFIVGPTFTEISNAQTSATNAAASATLASQWASKTDGIVNSTDYSAKAWAIGGTGVTDTASAGAAKEWATKTSGTVDTSGYSSKEWATGTQTRGAASGGSSKDWATYTSGTVDDTEYSAKYYANQAATSAAEAAVSAAASQWSDVVYVTNADSPVSVVDADAGTLYSVDTSGGAVTFNLPAISGLTLSGPWAIGIKKTNSDANDITVNRNGTDTIGGATSFTISRQYAGSSFIPDTDATPDDWTTLTFGEVPIDGDIVGTTDTQDLSAKTFTDAITLEEQSSTPSTPASGDKKFYAKNDGKLYTLDDAGNEIEVGSGGGGGGVTYINDDAEAGVTNLVAYADAAGTEPVDATGGSPNITVTEETSNPLIGSKSFLITKDAANRQGEGVAILSDTIDEAYQQSVHTVEFLWKPDANVVADALKLFVVHPTTGTVEALYFRNYLGEYTNSLPDDNSRVHRIASEIAPIDDTYRVVVHVSATDTTAYTGLIDNIQAGPQRVVNVPFISEWQNYSPITTGMGSATFEQARWRRVGDSAIFDFRFSTGTVTASVASIGRPTGMPGFEAPSQYHTAPVVGQTSSPLYGLSALVDPVDDRIEFGTVSGGLSSINGTSMGSGNLYSFTTGPIKIEGWDAGATLGQTQVDQINEKLRYTLTSAQTIEAAGSGEVVNFNNEVYDDLNAVTTGASWQYEAKSRTKVRVQTCLFFNDAAWGVGETALIYVRKNGTNYAILDYYECEAAQTTQVVLSGGTTVDVEAGDTIDIFTDITRSGDCTLAADGTLNYVSIEAVQDSTTIGAIREKNLIQTKILSADVTSATTISDLTCSNLTVGKWYDIRGQFKIQQDAGSPAANARVEAKHNSATIATSEFLVQEGSDSSTDSITHGISFTFQAEATSLTFDSVSTSANDFIAGDGTRFETYIQIEERNDLRETTKF